MRFLPRVTAPLSLNLLGVSTVFLTLTLSAGVSAQEALSPAQIAMDIAAKTPLKDNDITTTALVKQLEDHPDTVLIDVRTADELAQTGTVGLYQNINIPRGWIEFRIEQAVPNKDTPIVVYCGQNLRSPLAAERLQALGYTEVKNYRDGVFAWQAAGLDTYIADKAPDSILYDLPKQVVDGVYTAIGATQPSTYQNSGHNNNLSFAVAEDAVVVFNAGGSYLLAEAIHAEIRKVTSLPVKYLVLENAQGHAILGSNYWKEQGAEIIAHTHTAELINEELNPEFVTDEEPGILARAQRSLRDKAHLTEVLMPDRTFDDKITLPVEGRRIEVLHLGDAHSPDDIQLWLPDDRLIITGDFAFNERMLPILDHTNAPAWLENWPKLEALDPAIVIPGHGDVTDMATVRHYTVDYLEYLLGEVMRLVDEGGSLIEAYDIDQSQFRQWKTYRELSTLNAEGLFRIMEFEAF